MHSLPLLPTLLKDPLLCNKQRIFTMEILRELRVGCEVLGGNPFACENLRRTISSWVSALDLGARVLGEENQRDYFFPSSSVPSSSLLHL